MYANSTNELGNKQIDMQIRDFMQIRQDMQIRHAKRSGFQGRLRPFSCLKYCHLWPEFLSKIWS